MNEAAQPFDSRELRQVLGAFVTGVTVITAMDKNGKPHGLTANSFTSVSLEPQLVLFCAAKSSTTWPRIQAARKWAANILSEESEEVCRLFAQKGADRFAHIAYSTGRTGAPVLEAAIAFVDCETIAEHDAGDHVIVVGRVLELGYAPDGKPLLFYRGGYGRFDV